MLIFHTLMGIGLQQHQVCDVTDISVASFYEGKLLDPYSLVLNTEVLFLLDWLPCQV